LTDKANPDFDGGAARSTRGSWTVIGIDGWVSLKFRALDAGFRIASPHAILPRMATKRLPRPRDPAQLAKLIIDIAVGDVEDRMDDGRDSVAAEMGRRGGKARAVAISPERRTEIARKAAAKRWQK
jgi:hypothetical protein